MVVVRKGLNDGELGEIIRFALTQKCVRGVTFQPVQDAGRVERFRDPASHRLTLTEVRRRVLEQCDLFKPEDVIPVPCHPDCLAMAYALKRPDGPIPLTGLIDPQVLIEGGRNTIVYEADARIRSEIFKALQHRAHSPGSARRGALSRGCSAACRASAISPS